MIYCDFFIQNLNQLVFDILPFGLIVISVIFGASITGVRYCLGHYHHQRCYFMQHEKKCHTRVKGRRTKDSQG